MKTKLQQPLTRSMFWISTFLFLGVFIITLSVYVHNAYADIFWVYKYAEIVDVSTRSNVTYTLNNFHEWRIRRTSGGQYNRTGKMRGGFHRVNVGKPGDSYTEFVNLNGSNGIYDFYADYDFSVSVESNSNPGKLSIGRDYYCSVYTNLLGSEVWDNVSAEPAQNQASIGRSDDTFTAGEYPYVGSEDDKVVANSQSAFADPGDEDANVDVTP